MVSRSKIGTRIFASFSKVYASKLEKKISFEKSWYLWLERYRPFGVKYHMVTISSAYTPVMYFENIQNESLPKHYYESYNV